MVITEGRCDNPLPLANVRVTESIGESNDPTLVWNGSAFVSAWWDTRSTEPEIFTAGLRQDGSFAASPLKVHGAGRAKYPSLAFDGTAVDMVWSEESRVLFARLKGGAPKSRVLSKGGVDPSAGAWGAAVWSAEGLLYFRSDGMINPKTGEPLPPKVVASGGIETPRIAFNGIFFAVVRSESVKGGRQIILQRIAPSGEKLGSPVAVSTSVGLHREPSIVWDKNRFAVTWTGEEENASSPKDAHHVYFALIPEVGDTPLISGPTEIWSTLGTVGVATSGEEYALAWAGAKPNEGCAVYFQRFDRSGNPISDILEVSDASAQICSAPAVAWDGKGYGVIWDDDRGGMETEIYFSYIACGDHPDMPGLKARTKPKASNDGGANALPTLKDAF